MTNQPPDNIRDRLSSLRKTPPKSRTDEQKAEILMLEKTLLSQKQAALSLKAAGLRDADRRARTQRLIRLGALVEKAGLDNLDPAALLGALLDVAAVIGRDPQRLTAWKAAGGTALLAQRDDVRKPLIVRFPNGSASAQVRKGLRSLKLRWSDVRGEWDGFADPAAVHALVQPVGGVVKEAPPPAAAGAPVPGAGMPKEGMGPAGVV